MLTESDMQIYDIPECYNDENVDIRETLRSVLKEAGRQTGLDFSGGKYSVQFFPSRNGGGEMFVTRFDDPPKSAQKKNVCDDTASSASSPPRWEYAEAFRFERLEDLLAVCRQLRACGFSHRSAAFKDEHNHYYLFTEAPGIHRPMINEYGRSASASAIGLYITEHGNEICTVDAVEVLGKF